MSRIEREVDREESPGLDAEPSLRELRRGYHDRIADVRERSLAIVSAAVSGTASAVSAFNGRDTETEFPIEAQEMQALAAGVDAEVVSLLALESPMARDLRVILASRDVTQIALLCIGLCLSLSRQVDRAREVLDAELRVLVADTGSKTEQLLREAEASWATLDVDTAGEVARTVARVREAQTRFMAALIGMDGVPMDSALALAMVARAFERLADHAVEIAERVLFSVDGTPSPLPSN